LLEFVPARRGSEQGLQFLLPLLEGFPCPGGWGAGNRFFTLAASAALSMPSLQTASVGRSRPAAANARSCAAEKGPHLLSPRATYNRSTMFGPPPGGGRLILRPYRPSLGAQDAGCRTVRSGAVGPVQAVTAHRDHVPSPCPTAGLPSIPARRPSPRPTWGPCAKEFTDRRQGARMPQVARVVQGEHGRVLARPCRDAIRRRTEGPPAAEPPTGWMVRLIRWRSPRTGRSGKERGHPASCNC
jgi:hypothetical protein